MVHGFFFSFQVVFFFRCFTWTWTTRKHIVMTQPVSIFFFFFFNRLELRRLKSIVSTVLKKIFMFTMASQKCPGYKIGFTFLTHQKKKIQLIWLAHTKCSFKQALNFNTRWPKTIATRLQRLLCHLAQTPGK